MISISNAWLPPLRNWALLRLCALGRLFATFLQWLSRIHHQKTKKLNEKLYSSYQVWLRIHVGLGCQFPSVSDYQLKQLKAAIPVCSLTHFLSLSRPWYSSCFDLPQASSLIILSIELGIVYGAEKECSAFISKQREEVSHQSYTQLDIDKTGSGRSRYIEKMSAPYNKLRLSTQRLLEQNFGTWVTWMSISTRRATVFESFLNLTYIQALVSVPFWCIFQRKSPCNH